MESAGALDSIKPVTYLRMDIPAFPDLIAMITTLKLFRGIETKIQVLSAISWCDVIFVHAFNVLSSFPPSSHIV